MAVLLDQFVETLSRSGLMAAGEVGAFLEKLADDERPETSEELARLLVRQGVLTKFQAQCIYQGRRKGLVLGNYVVLESIGAGGMGHVYKAQHRRMKRVVALKVLPSAVAKNGEAVRRFHREVEAAAKLVHQNIVLAHDADEADGIHFLVMEFVDGHDLSKAVRKSGPLPVAEAVNYIVQAARGLEYAHAQGVVHRDIKPSNLVLDEGGSVKILDMGLARFEQSVGSRGPAADLTQSGQIMGTIDYMPPEQAEDTRRADRRADIYSLGCTLFFILTGRPVFQGETLMSKMLAHREAEIPSLSEERAEVPAELDRIFRTMVAKRPDDRHASMREVIADLEACHASLMGPAPGSASRTQGPSGAADTDPALAQLAPGSKPEVDDSALNAWLKTDLPDAPTQLRASPSRSRVAARPWKLYAMVIAAALLLTLLVSGIVLSVKTPQGTIRIHVDQPGARVSVDGGKITLDMKGQEPIEVEIAQGKHELKVTKGGFRTHTKTFLVRAGDREVLNVTLDPLRGKSAPTETPMPPSQPAKPEPPPPHDPAVWKALLPADAPAPAVAPFDEPRAKAHQKAWADYLDVPVEQEIDLGNNVKLPLILIPPGEFLMGSTEEEQARFLKLAKAANDTFAMEWIPTEGPQHRVRITKPFALGRCEVTVGQFRQFVEETDYQTDAERDGKGGCGLVNGLWVMDPRFVWNTAPGFEQTDEHPVVNVSWNDAIAFCQWLSKKQGDTYSLPTEAQWEYACRAGTTTAWHFGASDAALQEYAWFSENSGGTTHPGGQLKPNAWGLYDMHGNVFEWFKDWFDEDYYAESPTDDPSGPSASGLGRVRRGGHWWTGTPWRCRSAFRGMGEPDRRRRFIGFRVAAVVLDKAARAEQEAQRNRDAAAWAEVLADDAPAPAVAPFDEPQAKAHQKAWADYLDVPVEQEIDLGNNVKLPLILIPPGEFLMGSTEEEQARFVEQAKAANDTHSFEWILAEGPQQRVRIVEPFALGRHEVTLGQFRQFVDETDYQTDAERDGRGGLGRVDGEMVQDPRFVWNVDPGFPQTDEHPVVNVSWNDAIAFCQWLSKKQDATYDLPTEAQWEYACRAGTTTAWHFGDSDTVLKEYAWFRENSGRTTRPVGQLKPNAWGLYDMHGNVFEWCVDRFDNSIPSSAGAARVLRGGSWANIRTHHFRCAYRYCFAPTYRIFYYGFRVSRTVDPLPP